jgi:transposase
MYIDLVPNRNSPPAVLLRETHRVGNKTIKKTLANLSALPPEAIAALRILLKGGQLVEALADRFVVERSLSCGHVRAIKTAMEKLGIAELISSKPCRERDVILAMIAQRIVRPGSKLESAALFADTTLAADFNVSGVDEDALYAAMDWLVERQSFIEKKLAKRHLSEGAMVFYDVSSSSYHGTHCTLAQRGKNRDGLQLPCIVYGLLTDVDGRPVAVRVYPGNTGDPATVPDQMNAMRKEFGVGRFVIVGDRGMLTEPQITKLKEQEGCGWISCLRSGDIRKLMESRDPSDAPLFTQSNIAEISHPDFRGERLVACYNAFLAADRDRTRKELLACTEELLKKLARDVNRRKRKILSAAEIGMKAGKVIGKYKVAKHFALSIGDGRIAWSRKEEAIAREKALDGIYIVRTSETAEALSTPDVVRAYKRLGNVEKAFRTFKGIDLRVRPIHHRLEDRVRAHLFLCMLSYYIEWHMRIALAPLLYVDEDLEPTRTTRDPVARAVPSAKSQTKHTTKASEDGWPLRRWDGLLQTMATITENICRVGEEKLAVRFPRVTESNDYQKRVHALLDQMPRWSNNPLCPVNGTGKQP